MAWHFEESESDYVSVADHAALTFPKDTDWCLSFWLKLESNAGTGVQYITSWGSWGTTPSFNQYVREAGASSPGKAAVGIEDNDAVWLTNWTIGSSYGNLNWQHWLIFRDNASAEIHRYFDGVEDPVGGKAEVFTNKVDRSAAFLFGRKTGSTDYLDGDLAEAAFWSGWKPSAAQIAEMAAGKCPGWYKPNLAWWIPMRDDYKENIAGLTITNNGTVLSVHPPQIIYPPGLARTIFLTGAV